MRGAKTSKKKTTTNKHLQRIKRSGEIKYLIGQVVDFPQHTVSSRFDFLEKDKRGFEIKELTHFNGARSSFYTYVTRLCLSLRQSG